MDPRRRIGAREEDFEQGKGGVEPVLGDVEPGGEAVGEPADGDAGAEDDAPVDDGDKEGVGGDGGVEEGM